MTAAIATPVGEQRGHRRPRWRLPRPSPRRPAAPPSTGPGPPRCRAASSSDNTPATWAAVISPTEWPITTSGVTPQDCHNAANATSMANNAGWANSVCPAAPRRRPRSPLATATADGHPTRRRPRRKPRRTPGTGRRAAAPSPAIASLGRETRTPSCPLAWPGRPPRRARVTGSQPRQTRRQGSRSLPTSTARCSNTDRVVANDHATSAASDSSSSGHAAPPTARPGWPRPAPNAPTAPMPPAGAPLITFGPQHFPAAAGACSTMTCAFVPPIPNDDTPARRGRSCRPARQSARC